MPLSLLGSDPREPFGSLGVTVFPAHGFEVGDRVRLSTKSSRYRHTVELVISATTAALSEYRRPSRGYAKHLRRAKAKR